MNAVRIKNSIRHTWLWICTMVVIILGTGLFAFYTVSDKPKPTWDYRPVESLPSASPYAVYENLPGGQHVNGREAAK